VIRVFSLSYPPEGWSGSAADWRDFGEFIVSTRKLKRDILREKLDKSHQITVINAVKVFETVATLTQGGPAKASEVLLWTIYQEGFVFLHIGTASAMAVVFIVVLLTLLLIQTRILERQVHYS
jgi:hypothetical protein